MAKDLVVNAGYREIKPRNRNVPDHIQERRRNLMALRLAGVTDQRLLAQTLNVSQGTISKDLAAIDNDLRILAAQDRDVEKGRDLARIDALMAAVWGDAVNGDLKAMEMVMKQLQRRAAMLGYDAGAQKAAPAVQQVITTMDAKAFRQMPPDQRLAAYEAMQAAVDDDSDEDGP